MSPDLQIRPAKFEPSSDAGFHQPLDKIRQKTLVHGERTLMVEFRLDPGARIPPHSHPHEQIGYLVSGCLELAVAGRSFTARAGDSWCIPGQVEHSAQAHETTVAVEVFSPVREDYLPKP
jgi:unsaturated pyranuronate lyase